MLEEKKLAKQPLRMEERIREVTYGNIYWLEFSDPCMHVISAAYYVGYGSTHSILGAFYTQEDAVSV